MQRDAAPQKGIKTQKDHRPGFAPVNDGLFLSVSRQDNKKDAERFHSASLKIQAIKLKLLELNLSACSLELLLDLVSLSLRSSLLDGLRSGVNLLLSFLQAQAGDLADSLDDLDLGSSVETGEDDVELGLLLGSRGSTAMLSLSA